MGTFYQGTGFDPEEFAELKRRWDLFPRLIAMLHVSRIGHRIDRARFKESGRSALNADLTIRKIEEVLLEAGSTIPNPEDLPEPPTKPDFDPRQTLARIKRAAESRLASDVECMSAVVENTFRDIVAQIEEIERAA